jgi:hypothetical protein
MTLELDLGPKAVKFRNELRQWLEANAPEDLVGVDAERAAFGNLPELRPWTNKLLEAGYLCVTWPTEFGGRGLTGVELAVMNEEFARAGVPRVTRGMGEWLVGPSIIVWGTDEQKGHFLPRIIEGTDRYCQGFSEPNAGSDLASLTTRGVVDGDELVITGQKVWTSGAQLATMMFCLCRTDPDAPKHRGISYVLTPMSREDGSSNGFELRPIKQMNGGAGFTETFITEARVPLGNVIGGLHNGWQVTMTTLGNERGGNATTQHVQYTKQFWDAVKMIREAGKAADHALQRAAHPLRCRRPQGAWSGVGAQQDVLVRVRPAFCGDRDEHPGRRVDGDGTRDRYVLAGPLAGGVFADPLGDDLGRNRSGATKHRRRARARVAQGAQAGEVTRGRYAESMKGSQ